MKSTRIIMGMPVTVEIVDAAADEDIQKIFDYFTGIDKRFSTYKTDSEASLINQGKITKADYSAEMQTVLKLSEQTKQETGGYFDVRYNGKFDPSGLVKGWAIWQAAQILAADGFKNFYVEAGGDIQVSGRNQAGQAWQVGVKNPFQQEQIIKAVNLSHDEGMATSGTYIRGQHIYNPKNPREKITDIVSLTVIGPNIYEADRFATACFAMGKTGIYFLEKTPGLEGYIIDKDGVATMTSGFENYSNLPN